jgi:hypothetical protein
MRMRTCLSLAAVLTALLCGCTAVDAESQCLQTRGWTDRELCQSKARSEFRDYDRRRQELVDGEAARQEHQESRDRGMCFRRAATGELVCPN